MRPTPARPSPPDRRSLWAEALDGRPVTAAPAGPPRQVDVVVVGAGLAGLLAATLLADGGNDVLVVDRGRVGGQATRDTTAKASCLQGTVVSSVADARGPEHAAAYAAANLHGLDGIRRLVDRLAIDCQLRVAPAYTYATTPEGLEKVEREYEVASAAGLGVSSTTATDLPHDVLGAVRLDEQAQFHPVQLCLGLAEGLGAGRVLERTAVIDVEEHRDRCEVHLAGGDLVRADHVVIATQAPIIDPAALANRCHPEQSYLVALRADGPLPEGMYLSADDATRSVRSAGVDGDILLVGGEGHPVGEPEATDERYAALVAHAQQHWDGVEVTHRWATHDLVPSDHVPFAGRLAPGASRRWVATGFQKWGMTNAYVAAHLITEQIAGREVAWHDTFDATRIQASLTGELVSAGARAARHMVGDRIGARTADVDVERLEPGDGAVTTVSGEPVAVHRDAEGRTRAVSARCTHQGCLVSFGAATRTWDCPCHGSRFALDGQVLQGPAIDDLAPVDLPEP